MADAPASSGRLPPASAPTRAPRTAAEACNHTTTPAARSCRRFSGSSTAPPPHAITRGTGDAARVGDRVAFEDPELLLTVVFEDLGDTHPGVRLDQLVGVEERTIEQLGAALPHRRLARAHEADEHEVLRARRNVGHGATAATRGTRRGCARAPRGSRPRTSGWLPVRARARSSSPPRRPTPVPR